MDFMASSNSVPLFFTGFLIVYLVGYFVLLRRWPAKLRSEASSCVISLIHGTPAAALACFSIFSDPERSFNSPNSQSQNLVLDYSSAYFLMDLLHYVVFHPEDYLFIAHHLATLFVFLTCRFVVYHGAFALLVLLFLAEVTSFLQNAWTLSGMRRSDVKAAATMYALLSPVFYTLYSVVRGILGPYFVYRMSKFYISGAADEVIPKWAWISWLVVIVMAISVSILWISNLWAQFFAEKSKENQKKER